MPTTSQPRPRVLIIAFQGWSDAGDATSDVLAHMNSLMQTEVLHVIGAEGYVDFQVHRPRIGVDEAGQRVLDWPDTKLYGTVERPGMETDETPSAEAIRRVDGGAVTDLFLLAGVEPARDWQNFADEIVEIADTWGIDSVVLLGSMFSDAPHSRPIVTSLTSTSAELREETGAERPSYEGPVGITTVIDFALADAGIESVSLWAQVPHYVHSTPSPKATLALLDKLEELLDLVIPRGELLVQANEWEANINRIAGADEEMSRYIRKLEESRDEALAAEVTGDAIARDFEKFLEGDRTTSAIEMPARDATGDHAEAHTADGFAADESVDSSKSPAGDLDAPAADDESAQDRDRPHPGSSETD